MKTEREIRKEYEHFKKYEEIHRYAAMHAESSLVSHWIGVHDRNYALMSAYRDRKNALMWVLGIDPEDEDASL